MPLSRMKKVWDYCTYNKPFFLFVLLVLCVVIYIRDYYDSPSINLWILVVIINAIIFGYGMTITRDRINEGVRLPKILVKDVIILGFKSFIVFMVYVFVQTTILDSIFSPMNFPEFELEEMLLNLPQTINMLFSHNPVDTVIFLILGAMIFYSTTFFMEIALAKLADTGHLRSAFDLPGIKRDIDVIGWRNYTIEYTIIVVAIVLFTGLQYIVIPNYFLNYVWDVFVYLLTFATQFLGIGAVYSVVKKKKTNDSLE